MTDSTCGVLVFDVDASVQHVDTTAAALLDTTPESLVAGPSRALDEVFVHSGASLRSVAQQVIGTSEVRSGQLASGINVEVRATYGPEGANGAVATLRPENRRSSADSPDAEVRTSVRFRQRHLLERISSGAPLADILSGLISLIEEERPGMIGSILLYDAESGTLRHGAAPNLPDAYVSAIDGEPVGPNAGSCGAAAYLDQTIIAENIAEDERWAEYREVAETYGLQACWSTPIHGENDEVLGTFALYYSAPRSPSASDQSLIEEASSLASIAIEHDRHKQQLQLQSDQIRRLVENSGPIVFVLDADGEILIAEGKDLSALNVTSEDLVGQSVYDVYPDHPRLLEQTDRALAGETVDAVVELDGIPFDVWYAPYYDRTGTVAGCIGMAVDVTEQQAAETALREQRDVLRRTQELAHVGGWEYVPETNRMNGTEETYRICELPLNADLTLDQAVDLFSADTATRIREAAERCLTEGVSFDEEGPLTTPEGTRRWVRIRGKARWTDGTITKMVGSIQDLSLRHIIEERLREQQRWLMSITDNIAGGIYRSTEDGLVYANQAFVDMFGYDNLEEMCSIEPEALYADPSMRATLSRREQEKGGLDGTEVEFQRKDGSTFTGLLRSTQVPEPDGTFRYYDGVVTDITDQKEREESIRRQWEKIKSLYAPSGHLLEADSREDVAECLIDLVHDTFGYSGVAVHYKRDGQLIRCDASAPEEVSGAFPRVVSVAGDAFIARVFRSGDLDVARGGLGNRDVNGTSFGSVAGVSIGKYGVLTLASSEPEGIDTRDLYLIEILARKATAVLARIEHERGVYASEKRFRGLFEEAPLGIALFDANGRIVQVNPELESMFGYDAHTLRNRPFTTLGHPEDLNDEADVFSNAAQGNDQRYEVEKRCVRKDGDVFWAHLTISQHHGPGRAEGIAMIQDISDRKRYERQLRSAKQEAEEASRLKSNMLANMSHEIRTPLTSIIGFADTLRSNLSGPNARYADLVGESGKRLMETLDSVLQLSKLEAGTASPASETIDLVAVTKDAVELHRTEANTAHIDLQFEAPDASVVGEWDSAAVQRVLSNLVSNAIKFTPPDGSVIVRVRKRDDYALLTVTDTGIGIADSFRPRLFDAFTQESEGLKREHEGAGLGLAIVKRLVELMNGRIDVDSVKGKGTCFRVRLPR